ncbi:phosphoribosylanthranilate isomerase [Robiginitalea aurantiaca]|uniref:N-(5'-phosphoribosyl)anthranilate isomerase n=1 Tax=Robiginitalea aurantiaca TaxID=3056915 RepID=A0ABT7WHU8_9FLAO|nr:phosphoribosylanthranilate isomerase [Robiginitalea aurantiaca]MDM9632379.1 phosphoribosylanthranilate isomerase [Robiginitalea aurantiaca]
MKLKVCGMKYNPSEVMALGPDYLGFIFWEGTPRNFTGEEIPALPREIRAVGVFVDEAIPVLIERVKTYGLRAVQLHGKESPEYCSELQERLQKENPGVLIIKAFAIGPGFDFDPLKKYTKVCDLFLFDTRGPLPGGNGTVFNWEQLKAYPHKTPYFLSGGIGEKDCPKLLAFARTPQAALCVGIDVNSKFEIRPGEKNIDALKRFLECGIWKAKTKIAY